MYRKHHSNSTINGFQQQLRAVVLIVLMLSALPAVAAASPQRQHPDAAAPDLSLEELESRATQAPEVLLSIAELEESVGHLEQLEAEAGLQAFAGSDIGRYREPLGNDDFREYNRLNLKAGLRYPLLGTRAAEQKQILILKSGVREKEGEKTIALQESLLLLRKQYIAYWTAQEKRTLTDTFLRDDQELVKVLQQRQRAGLLLEADRLTFMSALSSTRRIDYQQQTIQQRVLGILEQITGASIGSFRATYPCMPPACTDDARLTAIVLAGHPRIAMLKEKIKAQQELIRLADKSAIDGQLSLESQISTEFPETAAGYGFYLNVRFDFPWKAKQALSAKRTVARTVADQLQQQLRLMQSTLITGTRDALNGYRVAMRDIDVARQRLAAAQERLRENLLRFAYLPGDVIEKVQQSRLEALNAALDVVDAQARDLVQQAMLLNFAPPAAGAPYERSPENTNGEKPEPDRYYPKTAWDLAMGTMAAPNEFKGLSFYIWHSATLPMEGQSRDRWFSDLKDIGVSRLLLSFTSSEIKGLQDPNRRQRLTSFLQAAHFSGLRVEWLLGDPLWILPEYRPVLPALITELSDLPFQGIHLDLEPDQLTVRKQDPAWILDQLCRTVASVKTATALPVGLSMHYRYWLDPAAAGLLAAAFETNALDEITLMIYLADPAQVIRIAGEILNRYPRLHFSIAQSVEPILPPSESYYRLTKGDFLSRMAHLSSRLNLHNFESLIIQNWQSFNEMAP